MGWRRIYLCLALVRLYFAVAPSYIHPDEHFQGPEVIAGDVLKWDTQRTWEFTSDQPIRSVFPLALVFGIPMQILKWIFPNTEASAKLIYYTLRTLFFLFTFVFEEWALQELARSPRHRRVALLLLASSYATWTYQTHTFSNSIETILVAWSVVVVQRINKSKEAAFAASAILGFLGTFGVFNRITYPAFVLVPILGTLSHYYKHPLAIFPLAFSALITGFVAIYLDSSFYINAKSSFTFLNMGLVITPLNNVLYNSSAANLSQHGLHAIYTHFLINLPQLLGPAVFQLLVPMYRHTTTSLISALTGTFFLSLLPHQEVRFLLPIVPLIIVSISVPSTRTRFGKAWVLSWLLFNAIYGILMGVYHQGGVVPAQFHLAKLRGEEPVTALWWKTYSPPTWLLGQAATRFKTIDLMGMSKSNLQQKLIEHAKSCTSPNANESSVLVAPKSALFLDRFQKLENGENGVRLEKIWEYDRHLNLDDMDFGDDGVMPTIERVIGRRGIAIWRICKVESSSTGRKRRKML